MAKDMASAIQDIQNKHGDGVLKVFKSLVQPHPELIWWEYMVRVR